MKTSKKMLSNQAQEILDEAHEWLQFESIAEELSSKHLVEDEDILTLNAGDLRISWPADAICEME